MNAQLSSLLAAMDILPDGLLVVDSRQKLVGCNRVAETLFGYQRGELLDKPVHVLLPPAMRDAHKRHISEFDPADGKRPMEERPILHGISKSGTRLPLSIGISTVSTGAEQLFVAVVRDARSLDDTLKDAKLLSETDPLTDLGNRRYLSSRLEEYEMNTKDRRIALLFLDLDRFKPLNDRHGHEVGDEVLRIVANRLRGNLRESDLCVRLGGDEFAVLVARVTKPDDLERIALKLHAGVTAPIHLRNAIVSVGVSIGGVLGLPSPSRAGELFKRADAAMYRAKGRGIPYCFNAAGQADAA